METIRTTFPEFVALRSTADLDRYETALERFAGGGSRVELMATLLALGIPAGQIRALASYPGNTLPAIVAE